MKIVHNKTLHCIFANGILLIPGTNCLESFDENTDAAKHFIDIEEITVKDSEKMSEKEQQKAVDNATTHANLETLRKTFKKVDTSKRKKTLTDYDKAVDEAMANGLEEAEGEAV